MADAFQITDVHAHLDARQFAADLSEVMDRAAQAGVSKIVTNATDLESSRRCVELARRMPHRVYATVGVHPHEAAELDSAGRARLEALLDHPRVVAVGESGLDYHYMNAPREVQRAVFAEQVATARERDLPLSLHVRGDEPDAFGEMLDIWRSEGRGDVEGVLHCYTGTLEFARRALEERLHISFSGILTFKRDRGLRAVAAGLPLDRLMVETDAPLLSPEGHRGRRNEPARVAVVGEMLAQVQGVPVEEVARITTRNARALFRVPAAA